MLYSIADSDQEEEKEINEHLSQLSDFLEQLKTSYPENFGAYYYILKAEKARRTGGISAIDHYEAAIQNAKESGWLSTEALSYELAANFYLSRGMEEIARLYLTNARDAYAQWEAWAKVRDLEQRHPQWLKSSKPQTAERSPVELDMYTVMKSSQAIAGEIVLEKLLVKMMQIVIENAGAQRGFLILEEHATWVIEA